MKYTNGFVQKMSKAVFRLFSVFFAILSRRFGRDFDGYSESDVFVGADGDFKYVSFNFKEIEEL